MSQHIRAPLLIVLIALLVLGVLITLGLLARYRQINVLLPSVIRNELQIRLRRDVRLGTAEVVGGDTLVITDLTVAEKPSFGSGTFLHVRRVEVRFKTSGLLFPVIPTVAGIASVTLIEPHIRLVRNRRGEMNAADLLGRPSAPPSARFRGLVSIQAGTITVADYTAHTHTLPAVNSLGAVDGRLDFGPPHSIAVDLAGTGTAGRLGRLRAQGRWGLDLPETDLSLVVSNADVPYWFGYFMVVRSLGFGQGVLSGRARITQPVLSGPLDVRGTALLQNASITSPYLAIPVKPMTADVSFTRTSIRVAGRGALGGSPLQVDARIEGGAASSVDVRVTSQHMDFNVLQRAVRAKAPFPLSWGSPGSLDTRIVGIVSNPTVTVAIRAPNVMVAGTPVRQVVAAASYRTSIVRVTSAEGLVAGGRVNVVADIKIKPFGATGSGTAVGVNLAALPGLNAIGRANARFSFAYRPDAPSARAQVSLTPGRIFGIRFLGGQGVIALTGPRSVNGDIRLTGVRSRAGPVFTTAVAGFSLRDRTITVSRAVMMTDGGQVSAQGTVVLGGALDLTIDARGLSAQTVLEPLGYPGVTGTAAFSGRLTGTVRNPMLEGSISAQGGHVRNVAYDSLSARVMVSTRGLVLRDLVLSSPTGDIMSTGSVDFVRNRQAVFDTVVTADRVDLSEIAALLRIPIRVSGIGSANLSIQGASSDPRISGQVSVTNAMIAGTPIDSASVRLQSVDGQTVISELIVRRGNMELVGAGTIGPRNMLRLDLRGENLDLSLVNSLKPYVAFTGPVDVSAAVTGTLNQPTVRAQLASTGLTINGQRLDSFTSDLAWDHNSVVLSNAALAAGPSSYQISLLRYIPSTKYVEVNAAASAVPIPALIALLIGSPAYHMEEGATIRDIVASIPQPADGILNASVTMSTSLAESTMPAGSLTLSATGISLASEQIGDLNVSLQSSRAGMLEQPEITASIRATNVAHGQLLIGSITSDKITIAGDRISTDRLVVQNGSSAVVLSGYLPFSLTAPLIPRDQPLAVSIELSDPEMATARYFPEAVETASGSLSATARITGTLDNPVGSGTVGLDNGFVKLAHFDNNFIHMSLTARLQGSRIIVDAFTGESSLGGSFAGDGSVNLAAADGGAVSLFLTLNALRLSETNITGSQGEQVSMTATGRLEVTQTIRNPIVEGQVVVSDADIVIPAKPVSTTVTAPPQPISTQLAVTLNLARNVTVRRGGLLATIVGPVTVAGTSSSPIITGTVQIVGGRLAYPGRTLQLLAGGTASLLFQPPQPSVLSVDVTAATTVTTGSMLTGIITRYRVFLDITGTVGDLSIDIRSSPPGLGDLQALSYVFGGSALNALLKGEPGQTAFQNALGQLLLGFALPGLFQPIEFGSLAVSFEPSLYAGFAFTVSTILSDRLSLAYSQGSAGGIMIVDYSINYALTPQLAGTVQFESQAGSIYETLFLLQYYKSF